MKKFIFTVLTVSLLVSSLNAFNAYDKSSSYDNFDRTYKKSHKIKKFELRHHKKQIRKNNRLIAQLLERLRVLERKNEWHAKIINKKRKHKSYGYNLNRR